MHILSWLLRLKGAVAASQPAAPLAAESARGLRNVADPFGVDDPRPVWVRMDGDFFLAFGNTDGYHCLAWETEEACASVVGMNDSPRFMDALLEAEVAPIAFPDLLKRVRSFRDNGAPAMGVMFPESKQVIPL